MKSKWLKLEYFHKSFIILIFISLILLVIGGAIFSVSSAWSYGIFVGIIVNLISYLIIWIFWYKIKSIKSFMAKATPWLSWLIRIGLFISVYSFIVFYLNPTLLGKGSFELGVGLDWVLEPINTIAFLLVYSMSFISYLIVWIIDSLFFKEEDNKIEQRKKGGKEE